MESNCKNCEVTLRSDDDYCPKCSQRVHLHRLSMHDVVHEGIHYFTHADRGFLTLIRDLAKKTGTVAKEFIDGKRKKYFPPLNFFLLVAALNLFAINANETYQMPNIEQEYAEVLDKVKPEQRQDWIRAYEKQNEAIFFIKKHSNSTVVVMLPIMAFVFWLFYRRKKYNYTEHLVAGMYMYGFATLVFVCLALLNLIFKIDENYIYFPVLVFQVIYFSSFYYRLFENQMRARSIFASLSAIISIFVLNGIAVGIYMFGPW